MPSVIYKLVYGASRLARGRVRCQRINPSLSGPQAVMTMAGISVHAINFIFIHALIGCVEAAWNGDQLSRATLRNSLAGGEQDILLRTQAQKAELEEIHRTSVQKRLGAVTARGYTREDANLGWGGNVRLSASYIASIMCLRVSYLHAVCMIGCPTRACRAAPHCSTTVVQPIFNSKACSSLCRACMRSQACHHDGLGDRASRVLFCRATGPICGGQPSPAQP